MALASINRNIERTGRGEFYLAPYPTADPGTDAASRLTAFFALFYADGAACKTLKAGVTPWANLTSDGLKVKVKQNVVEVDPNNGPKHTIGVQDTDMSGEMGFIDVDPAHLADAFGCSVDELIAQAAATGKAGRSRVLLGGQTNLVKYVGLYRMPSALVPGEFDNYLFLRILFTVDTEFDFNKKSAVNCKMKFEALPDCYLVNANGLPEQAVYDMATEAAS